jgi:transposase
MTSESYHTPAHQGQLCGTANGEREMSKWVNFRPIQPRVRADPCPLHPESGPEAGRDWARWRDLLGSFGPYTTCYNHVVRWRRAAVCAKIMALMTPSIVRVHQHGA